ncbi:MAG: MFS transporter [Gammaproteobacteria bacterium]|nr:MFS transporter [Gammaproteobacteria bacterium]
MATNMQTNAVLSQPAAAQPTSLLADPNWRLHAGWGVGTLGASFLLNSFAALQAAYLTTVLGIAAASAAALLFIAKLWDIVSNPLMGWISDRTHTRWGRRRPYLLLGGAVAGVAMVIFFTSALTPVSQSSVLIVLSLALVGTGYTIFNVPYMAMPSEMVDDYHERTRMMSWRVGFIGLGTLIGASAQKVAEMLGEGAVGYARMGVVYGLLIFIFMAWAFFGTAKGPMRTRDLRKVSFREQLNTAIANKPFMALLGVKFVQLFGLFTSTAMIFFLIKFVLGKEKPGDWMVLFLIASTVAQMLTIPFWRRLSQKIEKQKTFALAVVMFSLSSMTWLLASPDETVWFFCFRAVLKGFAAAGLILMAQSMLPDVIEYDYRKTGLRREGVFSGWYSFVEKVASAFAPSLLLLGYAWFGFQSKAPVQTQEALDGIRYCAAFLPSLYFGLSLIPLAFYRLTARELQSMPRPA